MSTDLSQGRLAEYIADLRSRNFMWDEEITSPDQKNMVGDTLLHNACFTGPLDFVERLLAAGCDMNARGDLDETPLHNAVQGGHVEIVTCLLDAGADTSLVDSSGAAPLEWIGDNDVAAAEIRQLLVNQER